jgi:DNA-binding transcriptional regulator YdaS (Cro superfamily)
MDKKELIQKAIDICGSQKALADACGVKQPAVSNWMRRDKTLLLERAVLIERATGGQVKASELRPDCYPV